jgi:Tfp pilus assembly protein PilX
MISNREKNLTGRSGERGIALLLCIFALLLLTGIALGLMFISDTETTINANYRDTQQAYFGAMAGLQQARVLMLTAPNSVKPSTMPSTAVPTGVNYILNPGLGEVITPTTSGSITGAGKYFDNELCNEAFNGFPTAVANVPCSTTPALSSTYTVVGSGTANALPYKWVRVTWKSNESAPGFKVTATTTPLSTPICWTGTKQKPSPTGGKCELVASEDLTTIYRLTSLAIAPLGSRRMLQMEVANTPPLVTNAAVDSQDHVTLNGQLTVNGYDYCSCNCTTSGNGANQVTTCTDRAGKTCDRSKYAIYASSSIDNPNNSETLVAGPNPPYVQNQPWLYDIPALIDTYKQGAVTPNWTCTAGSGGANASCGTHAGGVFGVPPQFPPSPVDAPAADSQYGSCVAGVGPGCPRPQVTYIPGNAQLTGGSSGNGILIVDGDLDIHGGLQFYGLILVKGVIKFTGGGSESTNIYGAVLAGQESYVDNVLGGSANIQFDVCSLKQQQAGLPPTMINFHELTY